MRKAFVIVISLFLITATILVIAYEEKDQTINFFTVKQNYLRLITEDESLIVSLFVDKEDSFLTDKDFITEASLSNEYNHLAVNIYNIELKEQGIIYLENDYNLYTFEVKFNDISIEDNVLDLAECKLNLKYKNDYDLTLSIGNVHLSFINPLISNHFDYMNMYGITNIIDNEKYLTGIVFKFDNYSNQPIKIIDMTSNNSLFSFDLLNMEKSIEKFSNDYIVTNSSNLNQEGFNLEEQYYYLIPIKYYDAFEKIYRFPITITYIFNDETYQMVIDDYLFFDEIIRLEEHVDRIEQYQYNY